MNKRPNYNALDPGIRETVRFLRGHRFDTIDSGDGYSKGSLGLDYPHVAMRVGAGRMVTEAKRLLRLLLNSGVKVGEQGPSGRVFIQASYDPCGGAILFLGWLDDARLRRARGGGA